jgi:hypothetical protein
MVSLLHLLTPVTEHAKEDDEGVLVFVHKFDPVEQTVTFQFSHILPKSAMLGMLFLFVI